MGRGQGEGRVLDHIAKVGRGHLVNSLEACIEGSRWPIGVLPCHSRINSNVENSEN